MCPGVNIPGFIVDQPRNSSAGKKTEAIERMASAPPEGGEPVVVAAPVEFELDDDPLGPLPGTRWRASADGDETRVHLARLAAERGLLGLYSRARGAATRVYDRLAQLYEFDSARGHIRRTVVLTGGLTVVFACVYATITALGLAYFEQPAALVLGYALAGLSVASLGCFAVTLRLTRCLACFASISYVMAVAFGAFSVTTASIAIAAFVANERYQLDAGFVSSVCVVLSIVFAGLVAIWAAAAHDARLTRLNMLMRGIPGSGELKRPRRPRMPWARWLRVRPAARAARATRDDGGEDEDAAAFAPSGARVGSVGIGVGSTLPLPSPRAPMPAALASAPIRTYGPDERVLLSTRERVHGVPDPPVKPVPTVNELATSSPAVTGRARVTACFVAIPLFVAGCLLLYPLVFSNAAAIDVEVLLVGSRDTIGDAHVAWEGALGAILSDENVRPSVRTLGLPDDAAATPWYRGVPMLPALARWRAAGVLKPLGRAPVQIVVFALRQRFVEPAPAPPPPPTRADECDDDPTYGSAWCETYAFRCGRPPYNARCPQTCGLCAPRSPPPSPPPPSSPPEPRGLATIGSAVPRLGRSAAQCIKSMLRLDTLGLGSRGGRTRLDAFALSDADLIRIARTRTRGGSPRARPRTVALADFNVVCFRGSDLEPASFWEGARAALGDAAVDEPACGVAAGVVGGMGPLAGAVYQQQLGELLGLHVLGARAPDAATSGAYAREAERACIEMYSNPQLAVDVRALLQSIGDSERLLIEQRTFLARADFASFAGPSNAWHEISFRLLVRARARRLATAVRRAPCLALRACARAPNDWGTRTRLRPPAAARARSRGRLRPGPRTLRAACA